MKKQEMKWWRGPMIAAAATAILIGGICPSFAQIKLNGTPTITPLGGGLYQWNYAASLTSGYTLNYGDFFTIYDFAGFIAGSQNPGGVSWSNTTNATGVKWGPTPSGLGVLPPDDPKITNLSWQWVGGARPAGNANLSLGGFSALSTYGGSKPGIFSQRSHLSGAASTGTGSVGIPDKFGVYVNDSGSGGAGSSGTGSGGSGGGGGIVTASSVAPEASSLVLLMGGASVFPVFRLFNKGRSSRDKK